MNWILRHSDKFDYHTNLKAVLAPIIEDIRDLKWLISDLEYTSWEKEALPINMVDDYLVLSRDQFSEVAEADMQIIWGVLLGIPEDQVIDVDAEQLPYADGNALVWKNGNIQHPQAIIEVICFDSGYTIVKFKEEVLSNKFRAFFLEAVELERFKNKSAPYY